MNITEQHHHRDGRAGSKGVVRVPPSGITSTVRACGSTIRYSFTPYLE